MSKNSSEWQGRNTPFLSNQYWPVFRLYIACRWSSVPTCHSPKDLRTDWEHSLPFCFSYMEFNYASCNTIGGWIRICSNIEIASIAYKSHFILSFFVYPNIRLRGLASHGHSNIYRGYNLSGREVLVRVGGVKLRWAEIALNDREKTRHLLSIVFILQYLATHLSLWVVHLEPTLSVKG